MSDLLYPIALTESLRVTPFARVVQDEFESGATASRLLWPAKYFRRQFQLRHAPLTVEELAVLRGFYQDRSGQHDTFWYRDNPNRGGNAQVRFAAPLSMDRERMVSLVNVSLAEAAAVAANADLYQVTQAAGSRPLVWWDANRIRYYEHPIQGVQTAIVPEEGIYDASERGNTGTWLSGGAAQAPGGVLAQTQYFTLSGQQYAKTADAMGLTGDTPAMSVFCFVRVPVITQPQYLWVMDADPVAPTGIGVDTVNIRLIPTPLGSQVFPWTANTWTGVCGTFPAGLVQGAIYKNGLLIASGALSARHPLTAAVMGGSTAGTQRTPLGADVRLAHCMVFAAELSAAQVKSLHNLLCPQFGLAQVP